MVHTLHINNRIKQGIQMILSLKERLSLDKISKLRARLKDFLISNGVDSETADDIKLVISEMLTNVYKHSYKENEVM